MCQCFVNTLKASDVGVPSLGKLYFAVTVSLKLSFVYFLKRDIKKEEKENKNSCLYTKFCQFQAIFIIN